MKKIKKEYSFKDWLSGDITEIALLHIQDGLNQEHGTDRPCLPDSEYEKIIRAKEEAHDVAVEITLQSMIEDARDKSPRWKELEIQKAVNFIDDNPDVEQRFEDGQKDTGLIHGADYMRILKAQERFQEGNRNQWLGITKYEDGKGVPSLLFEMHIRKRFLDWLKKPDKQRKRTGIVGRKPVYDREPAIAYYKANKDTLMPQWHKTGGKTKVAREIIFNAYNREEQPDRRTVTDWIEDYIESVKREK